MLERIMGFIQTNPKKTVSLIELQKLATGEIGYNEFAALIRQLEESGVLKPLASHGYNQKAIPLANSYRIVKSRLFSPTHEVISSYQLVFHPQIKLDAYYSLPPQVWEDELPFILRINDFLQQYGLPEREMTSPEISYALVGDEKWIEEKGGKRVLERLGLLSKINMVNRPDPLMLAVNPAAFDKEPYRHLVVENKSPFHVLLDTLPATCFLSLIYGAGRKVTGDIVLLERQLGLGEGEHHIYYFGDLDLEGVSIWHTLQTRRKVTPAYPFYRALLTKPVAYGKQNQQCSQEALNLFVAGFVPREREQIMEILGSGGYLPQEALSKSEMIDLWRDFPWGSN